MSDDIVPLLRAYLTAKKALTTANADAERKVGIVHDGEIYCVQFGKGGITGMAVAPHSDSPQPAAPDAPVEEPAKKRGRPPKAEKAETAVIPGPGSAPKAEAPAVDVKPMTKDEFRAHARAVAAKVGIDVVKAILGKPIDDLDPASYADLRAKIDAKAKEVL